LQTPVVVAAAAVGTLWGPLGVAWGVTIASLVLTYPAIAYCLNHTPLTMGDFVGPVWRPTIASLATAGLLFTSQTLVNPSALVWLNLLLSAIAFGCAYSVIFMLLPGGWKEVRGAYLALQMLASKRVDLS
jgi:PST family polysaccharide transporter